MRNKGILKGFGGTTQTSAYRTGRRRRPSRGRPNHLGRRRHRFHHHCHHRPPWHRTARPIPPASSCSDGGRPPSRSRSRCRCCRRRRMTTPPPGCCATRSRASPRRRRRRRPRRREHRGAGCSRRRAEAARSARRGPPCSCLGLWVWVGGWCRFWDWSLLCVRRKNIQHKHKTKHAHHTGRRTRTWPQTHARTCNPSGVVGVVGRFHRQPLAQRCAGEVRRVPCLFVCV